MGERPPTAAATATAKTYDRLEWSRRILLGVGLLALGAWMIWHNRQLAHGEREYSIEGAIIAPIALLLGIHVLMFGDDVRRGRNPHPRVYLTLLLSITAALANWWLLAFGYY